MKKADQAQNLAVLQADLIIDQKMSLSLFVVY